MQTDYYANLLIKQYKDKPKARGVINSLVELMPMDALNQANEAYSVDNAVGPQLSVLAKWVGVNRNYPSPRFKLDTYFAMPQIKENSIELTDVTQAGFQKFNDPEPGDGPYLYVDDFVFNDNLISDTDLRTLIKLKTIKNNVRATQGKIDQALWDVFGEGIYTTWPQPKMMVYNCAAIYETALKIGRDADWLPRPTDCRIVINEV